MLSLYLRNNVLSFFLNLKLYNMFWLIMVYLDAHCHIEMVHQFNQMYDTTGGHWSVTFMTRFSPTSQCKHQLAWTVFVNTLEYHISMSLTLV